MSVLTHDEILDEIARGHIVIDPFDPAAVGPASVDLHLGHEFRLFRRVHEIIKVTPETDYESVTEKMLVRDYLVL
ncbi:MAG: dCTP deaminase, partial [Deltaproteobacteria bacterium]|nr:dCTP deaminase [Deltaproteobacteria bacterium]